MENATSGWPANQSGGALIRIVVVLVIAFLVWKFVPLGFSTNPPNKQTPARLTIDGPTYIKADGTYTYILSLSYPSPLHNSSSYRVVAQVVANGTGGETLLDAEVRVAVREGSSTGKGSFAVSCTDPDGNGDFTLEGDDGSSVPGGSWHVFGRVQDQVNSADFYGGSGLQVICAAR